MGLEVIVLAAGAGTRMRSRLPKVLHPLAGRPLLAHVLDAATALEPSRVHVVIGDGSSEVKTRFAGNAHISWILQEPRRGTGDAVAQALPGVAEDATVLVLLGDVPLIGADTLRRCVQSATDGGIGIVTATWPRPDGFGARILRQGENVVGIVEERDATAAERAIQEVNAGILAAPRTALAELLAAVTPDNAQGEYYLTDVVALAAKRGQRVEGARATDPEQALGVNDRAQLAQLERYHQRQQAIALLTAGVALADPARLDIRGEVEAGRDCAIDVNVVLEGEVQLGDDVSIGANCVIRNSVLGNGVDVQPMSCIDGAVVAAGCRVGPFARLRPGTELGESVHIGNFVETKKAKLGRGAKANHLAYLGDASVGEECNIGAGAITCNYDGVEKHRTEIGDRAFVGTNATLVAPLAIGDEAYVGAGSTITSNVQREDLAVGRARQRNIQGWSPPAKRRTREVGTAGEAASAPKAERQEG